MNIKQNLNGTVLTLEVEGRLDTATAPQLEEVVKKETLTARDMILNLSKVEYISSSGLRAVLIAHKLMTSVGGQLIVKSPSDFCKQVFAATGMDSALSIQE